MKKRIVKSQEELDKLTEEALKTKGTYPINMGLNKEGEFMLDFPRGDALIPSTVVEKVAKEAFQIGKGMGDMIPFNKTLEKVKHAIWLDKVLSVAQIVALGTLAAYLLIKLGLL